MRGEDERSGELFSYVDLEARVGRIIATRDPGDRERGAGGVERELRGCIRRWGGLDPAGKLLRAMLLQTFYSIRSERLLMERLEYDLLFRWFVGIGVDDAAWDHSVFSKNRDRLLDGDIAASSCRRCWRSRR